MPLVARSPTALQPSVRRARDLRARARRGEAPAAWGPLPKNRAAASTSPPAPRCVSSPGISRARPLDRVRRSARAPHGGGSSSLRLTTRAGTSRRFGRRKNTTNGTTGIGRTAIAKRKAMSIARASARRRRGSSRDNGGLLRFRKSGTSVSRRRTSAKERAIQNEQSPSGSPRERWAGRGPDLPRPRRPDEGSRRVYSRVEKTELPSRRRPALDELDAGRRGPARPRSRRGERRHHQGEPE